MLAGHFPFVYGAERAWLVVVVLMLVGAWVRLFFNLRHTGQDALVDARRRGARRPRARNLVAARTTTAAAPAGPARRRAVQRVWASGCVTCHSLRPTRGRHGAGGPELDAAKPIAALEGRA